MGRTLSRFTRWLVVRVERARKGGGPTLVEAKTYRFHGHSLGDEEQYRSSDEVETWKTDRDPITLFRTVMMHKNWLTEDEDAAIQEEAKDEIVNAVKFAEESPYPTVANVTTDVLAAEQEVA